jgi:hypothetical protein
MRMIRDIHKAKSADRSIKHFLLVAYFKDFTLDDRTNHGTGLEGDPT